MLIALCPTWIRNGLYGDWGPLQMRLHRTRLEELYPVIDNISMFRVVSGVKTTCSREVAVSVLTPPKAPRETGRAVLADKSEAAGRARR